MQPVNELWPAYVILQKNEHFQKILQTLPPETKKI